MSSHSTSSSQLDAASHTWRRQQDFEGYRVLLQHAVDDASKQEDAKESHVILFELPDLKYFATASSDLSNIPEFDPSQMEDEGVSKALVEQAIVMVEQKDRHLFLVYTTSGLRTHALEWDA